MIGRPKQLDEIRWQLRLQLIPHYPTPDYGGWLQTSAVKNLYIRLSPIMYAIDRAIQLGYDDTFILPSVP